MPRQPTCLVTPSSHCGSPVHEAAPSLYAARYNDLDSVKALFAANKGEIAGVILEPVVGNSGFIPPTKEFLQVGSQLESYIGVCIAGWWQLSDNHWLL